MPGRNPEVRISACGGAGISDHCVSEPVGRHFAVRDIPPKLPTNWISCPRDKALSKVGVQPGNFLFKIDQLLAAGHEGQQFFAADVLLIVRADAAAPLQDRESVTDHMGMMHIVRDENDADSARLRFDCPASALMRQTG